MTTLERGRELFTRRGPEGHQKGTCWTVDDKPVYEQGEVLEALEAGRDVKMCALGAYMLAGGESLEGFRQLGDYICDVNNADQGYDAVVARYDEAIARQRSGREVIPVGTD